MRKTYNSEHLEGRIYEHNLTLKTVQNKESANFGKEFISGTIDIAVDEEGTNIVQNHFTYVTAVTKKGNANATFTNLKKIIDDNKTWLTVGKDEAQKIKIDNITLSVNDFYDNNDNLVSAKRNEGGFVSFVGALNPKEEKRHTFTTDIVINNAQRIEANEERNIAEHVVVRGGVFGYKNVWYPVELVVEDLGGMNYFESLEASDKNPIFTQVWGTINGFKVKTVKTEKSAFGEAAVREYESNRKVWLITGSRDPIYDFGGDDMSAQELEQILQNRNIYLAEVKKNNDDYKASKAAGAFNSAPASNTAIPNGTFNF